MNMGIMKVIMATMKIILHGYPCRLKTTLILEQPQ